MKKFLAAFLFVACPVAAVRADSNICWSGFEFCPNSQGYWPPCFEAVMMKNMSAVVGTNYFDPFVNSTFIDAGGVAQSVPANLSGCPCCVGSNGLNQTQLRISTNNNNASFGTQTNYVNDFIVNITTNGSWNGNVSGLETTACVTINPFVQKTAVVGFMGTTSLTEFATAAQRAQDQQERVDDQAYVGRVAQDAGLGTSNEDFNTTRPLTSEASTFSNIFYYPYGNGGNVSNIEQALNLSFGTNASGEAGYYYVGVTNAAQGASDKAAEVAAAAGQAYEDVLDPNAEAPRDPNLVVDFTHTRLLFGMVGIPVKFDCDPLRYRFGRLLIEVFYLLGTWAIFFWGVERKYQTFVEWFTLWKLGRIESNTVFAGDWKTNLAKGMKRILVAGWVAIMGMTVLSLLSACFSTWSVLAGAWPLLSSPLKHIAISEGGNNASFGGQVAPWLPKITDLIQSFISLVYLATPVRTALITFGEVFAFRAKCATLVAGLGMSFVRRVFR